MLDGFRGDPVRARCFDSLVLVAGASLTFAFAPFQAWYWAPVPLAVLFVATVSGTVRQGVWRGLLFGLGFFGVGLAWIVESFKFNAVPYPVAVIVTTGLVVLLSGYLAAFGAVTAACFGKKGSQRRGLSFMLSMALGWMLIEWIRGNFFTGFPWMVVGTSQVDGGLSGWLPLLGSYGTSFWVALIGAVLAACTVRRSYRNALLGGSILTLVVLSSAALHGRAWSRASAEPMSVALVQGNVSQDQKWKPENRTPTLRTYLELTSNHWNADLVVWPETAIPGLVERMQPFLRGLETKARHRGTELLVGIPSRDADSGRPLNTVLKLGGLDSQNRYVKRHLVPFGEYLPLAHWLEPTLAALGIVISNFQGGEDVQPLLRIDGRPVGVSICYEVAFASEIGRALPHAELLVNVSNDAWFGDTLGPPQHLQLARARAREAGRWLVRATNTGITAVIDPHGRIQAALPQFKAGAVRADVIPQRGVTPYFRIGDDWLAAGGALLWIFVSIRRRETQEDS